MGREGRDPVHSPPPPAPQFEATDARRCFPCWDEPSHKATFTLSVTAPTDRIALSNMHAVQYTASADGKLRTTHFAPTPTMSTYLVALVVGEFDCVSRLGSNGVLSSVYVPPGKAILGGYALHEAVTALEQLEKFFGIPCMDKQVVEMKHLAIPDFSAGAMENTGCITYREALLLVDSAATSMATKQRVALVVAHELSHQWCVNV